ncbi:hypothetical protein Plhal304r1_c009g0034951 [Plasmopara halstedii]
MPFPKHPAGSTSYIERFIAVSHEQLILCVSQVKGGDISAINHSVLQQTSLKKRHMVAVLSLF